jgi:hypothetical protein
MMTFVFAAAVLFGALRVAAALDGAMRQDRLPLQSRSAPPLPCPLETAGS